MSPLHIHSYYLCRYSKNCGSFLNANSSQLDTHRYLVVMFNDNKKKYGFIHSAKEITFTNSTQMWRDFINCDKIWHHPFKKRWKWYVLWIFQEETCHFAERYTWIMRTRISSCCHILSAVSVCECVTLCRCVSLLSGGWCVSPARCWSARMWRGSSTRLEDLDQKERDPQWYLCNTAELRYHGNQPETPSSLWHFPILSPSVRTL